MNTKVRSEVCEIGDSLSLAVKREIREETVPGARILVRALEYEGVDVVFGYPGGKVLALYDELYQSPQIRHILTRHEQGAAHAADGYARATGKPGVVIATSGPGATNLVTGIANAYMDSIPMVVITGQVGLELLGRDTFQEVDMTGITLPITKYSYLIKNVEDLAQAVREAFHLAGTGRPGPVVIDFPQDIADRETKFNYPVELNLPGYRIPQNGFEGKIQEVSAALAAANRPLIVAGGGVINSGAHQELKLLAERLGIPVTITLMGKGAFPETHPLCLGMLGMHGTAYANLAACSCDLLLAFGMRFDDRVTGKANTFAPEAKIVHVDIDPAEIGKNVRADIPIVGDVRQALIQILASAGKKDCSLWREQIARWKKEHPLGYQHNGGLKPQYVVEQIYEATGGEACICTDVGQHQMWAAQYFRCNRPRSFISSGGLGTMGFGLPAAMGAQVARPDALVFSISGDGSIQMNIQELATCVQYRLPIKIAIINNQYLGLIRQWQELFYHRRYSQSDISVAPDFLKLAEAYGIKGRRVTRPEGVRPAIEEAINTPGAFILDFMVEREENVFPMVPAGGSLNKMLGR